MSTDHESLPRPSHKSGTFLLGGDLPIFRMGFGAMRLTGPGVWGEPADRAEARRVLERALDLGVTLVDTADCYGPGISEAIIAEVLTARGVGDVVVATKGGFIRTATGMGTPRGTPEHLRATCEESLGRLRLDHLPLYQLHAVDPAVPIEESVGALVALRGDGKIRHIGLSNVTLEELRRALAVTPIASVQNRYNLGDRRSETLIEFCADAGIAFLPWGPLSLKENSPVAPTIAAVADETGASTNQVVLAWTLARSAAIVMIPGTRSVDHVDANVRAAEVTLTTEQFARLDMRSRTEYELLNDPRPAGQIY